MTWHFDISCRRQMHKAIAGYSLLEILIVLTILALISGLTPVAYSTIAPALQTRELATEMAALLRDAQSRALHEGQDVTVFIDIDNRRVWFEGEDTETTWSDKISVVAIVAASQQRSESIGGIRFFSDGGSTGGRLRFLSNGREYNVDVDWLLGVVQVTRLDTSQDG